MIDLTGRRVLVTGASGGIGAASCRLFARAGAAVAVHYRSRPEVAESLLEELGDLGGGPHFTVAADLGDEAAVRNLFGRLSRQWDGLDCLVNNAGIWERNPLDAFDPDLYRRTLRANVDGVFLCVAGALALLRRGVDPNVINITSTAAQRGEALYSPYAASKGALVAATKSWASELAPTIRVNSVAPGWVDTPMCDGPFAGGGKARIAAAIPLGRIASADDVAGPVLFLASAFARHLTGEIINVNGGSVLAG